MGGNKDLVQLFSGADADNLNLALRADNAGKIEYRHCRDSWNKNLTTKHHFKAVHDKACGLFEGNPESRHSLVGHRKHAGLASLPEQRNHASPAGQNISVSHNAEPRAFQSGIGVPVDEEFLRAEFRSAVKVDRIDGFIATKRDDPAHPSIHGGIYNVFGAHNIGFNGFKWVVLQRGHLL